MAQTGYKVYLVGGAVRDQLLHLPVKDRDWVVVGATPEQLLAEGYRQVGKDFPVFLNPHTQEEYALARTERKTGFGYNGFSFGFSPEVTLEEDLIRRDLTVNAIARNEQGEFIDPYGGIADLDNRILRHVSPAFGEDPLRVLRVARFAARLHGLGFVIAAETLALMAQISRSGELEYLTAERVWRETEKALNEPHPEVYFEVLRQVGALAVLMPELNALYGVPNPAKYHPEIDSFVHTMLVLRQSVLLTENTGFNKSAVRFSAICHDLGKALTAPDILPHHYGHERAGLEPVRNLCRRLKVPAYSKELALFACEYHSHVHKAFELRPKSVLNLFNKLDVWRKPQRFRELMLVCVADTHGRAGFEHQPYPQKDYLWQCYRAAAEVDVRQVIKGGFRQKGIRDELNRRRRQAIAEVKRQYEKMR